jgi:hypothetical protein
MRRILGEVHAFVQGCVTAANYRHGLVHEKRAVARGAVRHAVAEKLLFPGNPEFGEAGAGGDNQRLGAYFAIIGL